MVVFHSEAQERQQCELKSLKPNSEQHFRTRWLTIQGSVSLKDINSNRKKHKSNHFSSFEKPY